MTSFKVERFPFDADKVKAWGSVDPRHSNWPVVYVMNNTEEVYVGESLNVEGRMKQHLESDSKRNLESVRVVLDDTFNKSACLDLESFLIRMFHGDASRQVLNLNAGITDADYYDRDNYNKTFHQIFEELRTQESLFKRTIPQIINSDLFKLSPFKALNHDQAIAVDDILEGFFDDLESGVDNTVVVEGNPGTGKTVVAIYLLKLLEDIRRHDSEEPLDIDSVFSDYFTPEHAELLKSLKFAIVVPQQSLRDSIAKVFKLTPGLSKGMVLTPFEVGESTERFDLLVVDEAHRLNQRANQASGPLNKKFIEINEKLFGWDDPQKTQLDWIQKQSHHSILMLDVGQTVRPADLPATTTRELAARARAAERLYPLQTQMRISTDKDYVSYIRKLLSDDPPESREDFGDYDLRLFTDLGEMTRELQKREVEHGLSRLVAGYAWPWKSKNEKTAYDLELDGQQMRWNTTTTDWINSAKSVDEVGSIHTVQGYDLNYVGVIIGNDLRYDPDAGKLVFDRASYHDKKGRENNPKLGITYSDADLLEYVKNIYSVLLTRGIRGTYVYICDPALHSRLKDFI
ncbi:DNA/RNA helicase domain-containing protein [Brevibacterium sp. CSND-B09]|uniref:DNA/RNA helicase domain-containing protein n=1 Tax=Brevibacterium sp. CSND-B09 TaxID=3462571 RepID=UPI00406A6715